MQDHRLFVRFAILTVLQLCNAQSKEPITCTAGYYRAGETANVTCHYHGDITTTKNSGAYIQRHKLDARDLSSGMEVTVCHFSGGSVSVCDPEAGYRFVSFSPRNLTIDVPHVSAEFQGRYTCGLVPPPGESPSRTILPCLLVVEETAKPENNVQQGPGVDEALHGHVQAVLALLIIVIIVAVAVIVYTALAYNKSWFPFRKAAKPKNRDAEKGKKRNSSGTRPIVQKTTNPIYNARASELEQEGLLNREKDEAPGSASRDEAAARGGRVLETKPETEDERRDRENRENAEKAAEEIRKAQEELSNLKQSLTSAPKNDQKDIKKAIKLGETRLKQLKKNEEERRKRLEKAEEERKKREEKERKGRGKAEKGKKK